MSGSRWVTSSAGGRAAPARATALVVMALGLAACGGAPRQDADEPRRDFRATAEASLDRSQRLAEPSDLVITVRNMDSEAMPDVSVTLQGLTRNIPRTASSQRIGSPARPIWVVDEQPQGAPVANRTTWTMGRLAPGAERTFRWKLAPVVAGEHRIRYRVAAGVEGNATARDDAGGGPLGGSLDVSISDAPGDSRVDPDSGQPVGTR